MTLEHIWHICHAITSIICYLFLLFIIFTMLRALLTGRGIYFTISLNEISVKFLKKATTESNEK
jgi:hypothetical protein